MMDCPTDTLTAAEFCRQARKLRAVHERHPVEMHRRLRRLSCRGEAKQPQTPVATEHRPARAIRWTWTQSIKLGMSLLGRIGGGLSITAADPVARQDIEDDQPRYTMIDPNEPPVDQGYPGSNDRTFGTLVLRTLRTQLHSPLRYSQRLELLKEAGQRGIGRFEANLIIASAQHRLKSETASPVRPSPARMSGLIAYLLVQSMILWGVWRATRS